MKASANNTRYVVHEAQNFFQEEDPYASKSSFLIDGDQSKGYVSLIFDDVTFPNSDVPNAILQVRISDHTDADSRTGFVVFVDGQKVGESGSVKRGTSVSIPLILPKRVNGRIELILRASGPDGVYIQSKYSQYAPTLEPLPFVIPSSRGDAIRVTRDNNYLESPDDDASESDFIIDGDQSRGRVSLYFEDIELLGAQITKPVLQVKTSDLTDAASSWSTVNKGFGWGLRRGVTYTVSRKLWRT